MRGSVIRASPALTARSSRWEIVSWGRVFSTSSTPVEPRGLWERESFFK